MYPNRTLFLIFLLWFQVIHIQWWDESGVEACLDIFFQNYECSCEQPGYDYSQYMQIGYPTTYYQPITYDYQYYYRPNQEDQQQPLIIIVNNEDHKDDWELFDIISLITSLNDKSNNEPVYIPYPVLTSCGSDCDVEWDSGCHSDCGCRNKGKCNTCKNERQICDCGCDDCERRKKGRSKSKSRSSDNCRCKSERGRSNKYDTIKHRCDCGF
ncbi:unnamed protein product [Euphydryas editha]|uniref:Uncharacterized protein n=1 Tax=Euphydryas editha TaxID=104508 RepID=A0AAU9UNR0_EUPED|nr:unnamed protein product [Euphydryas editha]